MRRHAWRLLRTGSLSAARNMAVDEALLNSIVRGAPPILRTYGWEPPGVSIGYAQPTDRGLNLEAIHRRGYDLVRRPTGGRAIIHRHELTYSVALLAADLPAGESVMRSYREISRGIEAGLELLGIPARVPTGKRHPIKHKDLPSVCFAASLGGDMEVAGRKIVGSAQMRRKGAILQHGSIPITFDFAEHLEILGDECIDPETGDVRLRQGVAGVADVLGREIAEEELAEALIQGFAAAFGIQLEEVQLTAEENAEVDVLERGKYLTEDWNLRRVRTD